MKFGLFYLPTGPDSVKVDRLYSEVVEQCAYADELGYDSIWFAEHHFSRMGICPDPWIMGAAIAPVTKRVRIGSAVSIMPFRNPLQVAEQVAMVDQLSGGRAEFGMGRGAQPSEFLGFGAIPAQSRQRLRESLAIIRQAWTVDEVNFKGEYYDIERTPIYPKTVQKPHPPIWVAASSADTFPWVAEEGLGLMATAAAKPVSELREQFEAYKNVWTAKGRSTEGLEYPLNIGLHLADSTEQALAEVSHPVRWFFAERKRVNEKLAQEMNDPSLTRTVGYDLTAEEYLSANALVGDPDFVLRRLRRLEEQAGLTYVLGHVYPEVGHQKMMKAIKLLAEEVMPAFREAAAAR